MRKFWQGALMSGAMALAVAAPVEAAKVERVVSPGGVEAFLLHEPSVPLIAMSFYFKGGAQFETAATAGLARMTAALLDEGAGDKDSLAFRTELEDNAIRLGFDANRDGFSGDLRTLSANRELAFELARLALNEPRFDAEPIERIRAQSIAMLRRRENDPNTLAREHFFRTAFPEHTYGISERGTIETVSGIERDDLVAFIQKQLVRDRLHVGVAGDITAAELAPVLDRIFGGLPATGPAPEVAAITPLGGDVLVVPQAVPQSVVFFGHPGIARQDPDYYAAYIANYIIGGGGFQSRLLQEIREKRGLAYSAHSFLLEAEHSPLWVGGVATNNADVAESIRLVREQVAGMAAGEISAEDLAGAQTFLTGSFPLRLTSNAQVASLLVGMSVADLGVDFLERRNAYIEAVTLDDLHRVAARMFDPDALLFVVVGQPQGLEG
ncbi:MAG: insulinase family protein [Geminicoccaceae bacterium]|nr:MAG: insulinase family protein [Geminicoccaceae bacterium]